MHSLFSESQILNSSSTDFAVLCSVLLPQLVNSCRWGCSNFPGCNSKLRMFQIKIQTGSNSNFIWTAVKIQTGQQKCWRLHNGTSLTNSKMIKCYIVQKAGNYYLVYIKYSVCLVCQGTIFESGLIHTQVSPAWGLDWWSTCLKMGLIQFQMAVGECKVQLKAWFIKPQHWSN